MDQAICIHTASNDLLSFDPAQLTADLVNGSSNPAPKVQQPSVPEARQPDHQLLSILCDMQKEMRGMSARLQDIESQHGPAEEQELSCADRMDRVSPLPDNASAHTFQGEDDQEEDDKENAPTGTKLFPVGDKTETFLKTCFAGKSSNGVRRQWRDKHGAPHTAVSACPRLDKLLKGNLSAQTKSKDKAMAKSQALLLDAVGPLTFLLEELDKEGGCTDGSKAPWECLLPHLGRPEEERPRRPQPKVDRYC